MYLTIVIGLDSIAVPIFALCTPTNTGIVIALILLFIKWVFFSAFYILKIHSEITQGCYLRDAQKKWDLAICRNRYFIAALGMLKSIIGTMALYACLGINIKKDYYLNKKASL